MTPPLFLVMHGRREIGQVDEAALIFKQDGNRVLSLGGNAWKVNFIDWQRKFAYVEPTDEVARTRWAGSGIGLSFDLCQTMQSILCDSEVSSRWSKRGQSEIERLRGEFSWLESEKTSLNFDPDSGCTWWTFCGAKANSTVAYYLAQIFDRNVSSDGFSLKFPGSVETEPLIQAIGELQNRSVEDLKPMPHEHAIRGLKFSSCLYPELAQHVMSIRLRDNRAVTHLLETGISMKKISDGSAKPSIGNRRSNYARPAGPVPKSKRAKRIPESTINLADRSTADTALQALSIRQPWAELILRGEKTIEYRSLPTKVRGKIYIYASATRYEQSEEKKFQENLEFSIDVLPRGVIVGTVEIFDCNESDEEEGHFEWLLQNPIRLELPLKPECRPNPVWFYPFRD